MFYNGDSLLWSNKIKKRPVFAVVGLFKCKLVYDIKPYPVGTAVNQPSDIFSLTVAEV